MAEIQKQILIVDDSPIDIEFIIENLKSEYSLIAARNGKQALELARQQRPDVVLLDVSMPEMDGYAVCSIFKGDPDLKDIDILFVSANDSVEEKLKGYEVGGSDYLIKPVQPTELKQKVILAIKNADIRAAADSEKQAAMDVAMTAIMDAGEQAIVVDCLRHSFNANTIADLAQLIVESTAKFDLLSTVMIHCAAAPVFASNRVPIPPLEQELLSKLRESGRIHEIGIRMIINFNYISMIIKNMPDDKEKSGRIRDHVALMLEGANSAARNLIISDAVKQMIEDSNEVLSRIQMVQAEQKRRNMEIMDELKNKIQFSFLSYDVSEEQEQLLLSVTDQAVKESLENYEEGVRIDEEMKSHIDRLAEFSRGEPQQKT